VDFEQERCPPVHAATDLKGYDSTVSDNTVHDELVGRGLCDLFVGFLCVFRSNVITDSGGR
jgi:hypothetical protein